MNSGDVIRKRGDMKKSVKSNEVIAIFKQQFKQKEVNRKQEGKTVSLNDLPACQHKTMLLEKVTNPKTSKICVVAVKLSRSWVAYVGYPDVRDLKINLDMNSDINQQLVWDCEHIHNVEQVLMLGNFLNEETARALFPEWRELKYKKV